MLPVGTGRRGATPRPLEPCSNGCSLGGQPAPATGMSWLPLEALLLLQEWCGFPSWGRGEQGGGPAMGCAPPSTAQALPTQMGPSPLSAPHNQGWGWQQAPILLQEAATAPPQHPALIATPRH